VPGTQLRHCAVSPREIAAGRQEQNQPHAGGEKPGEPPRSCIRGSQESRRAIDRQRPGSTTGEWPGTSQKPVLRRELTEQFTGLSSASVTSYYADNTLTQIVMINICKSDLSLSGRAAPRGRVCRS
jgi:hypothetical protein